MATGRRRSRTKTVRRAPARPGATKRKAAPARVARKKPSATRGRPARTSAPGARATIPDSAPSTLAQRHDTPVDVPAVRRGRLAHDTPVDTPAVRGAEPRPAIARPAAMESLESAYEGWLSLRTLHQKTRERLEEERKRLEHQGALLVGAMKVGREAMAARPGALVATERATADVASETEARLAQARSALEAQAIEAEAEFARLLANAQAVVRDRVERSASLSPPLVRLAVQSLPGDRRILQLQRPSPDDSVTVLFVLSGRIPSRYESLRDDASDDVSLPPASLYAELGIDAVDVRPTATRLEELLAARPEVWPLKGMLAVLPDGPGPKRLVRWLSRGPVLEAEIAEDAGFRSVLTPEEAEQVSGQLMRHSLEQRLTLELVRQ